jgi:phosphopantothenoylcysteine decarboxylase/phosphopantothenate--cysteine ligase
MAEPEHIIAAIEEFFISKAPLRGKRALVTAGPTYEPIDPVRFVGNHSSGKMGFAIAHELAMQGAEVELVAGPVSLQLPHPSIKRTDVMTAAQMHATCTARAQESDIIVMAAAVADYRPAVQAASKIKKQPSQLSIALEPTTDILAELGKGKRAKQLLIGFALETDNEVEHATQKLERKGLDLIVLNSLRDAGAGFGHDTNKVTLIEKGNKISTFELKSKAEIAVDIVRKIISLCEVQP